MFEEFESVILTSIDSELHVAEMNWVREIVDLTPDWAQSIEPLVISGRNVLSLLSDRNIFTGFDEIWIPGHHFRWISELAGSLIAPENVGSQLPDRVRKNFLASRCILGIGDGDGLNLIWDSNTILEFPVAVVS
jgi:hypothetical protein